MKRIILKSRSGQTVVEYFIIFAVILAAILSTGFLDRIKNAFDNYLNRSQTRIVIGI